jgi:hypothetical protein
MKTLKLPASLKDEAKVKNVAYVTGTLLFLFFVKLTHPDMKWVPFVLLAIFSSIYLRNKYIYPIIVLALITIFYVIADKPTAYNFYFAILFIVVVLGLAAELFEVILKRIFSSL